MNIETWNVRSWYRTEAANSAIQQLVAVQELRWHDSGNLRISGSVVFFSGNQYGRHEGGTGFVIKEQLVDSILNFEPISDKGSATYE